jgi:protoporphyrinogen oxidase
MKKRVIILGAGLAGLSCGYELVRHGLDVTLIEKENEVGGLAKSFQKGKFTYDLGPHRFHSEKTSLIEHIKEILDNEIVIKKRKSEIFLKNHYFEYPLRTANIIAKMPLPTLIKIFYDYFKTQVKIRCKDSSDNSFEDWVTNRFGKTLYEIFFKEYTEKTWGLQCSEISSDYAAQRITLLNLWDAVIKSIFKTKNTPRTYVSQFYYPREGGIGEIAKKYQEKIAQQGGKIFLGSHIKSIQVSDGGVQSVIFESKGTRHSENYDYVCSTIPMTELTSLITPQDDNEVKQACSELFFRSIVFVYLIINRPRLSDNHWIYIPERRFLSNRISEFKNFNEDSSPPRKTMICSEITCFCGDRIWNMNNERLVDRVTEDLVQLGLIGENEVEDYFIYKMEHAYPIYDLYYQEHLGVMRNFLNRFENLYYFGRNALFRYNNMDHSVEMGLTVAEGVISGKKAHLETATTNKWFG